MLLSKKSILLSSLLFSFCIAFLNGQNDLCSYYDIGFDDNDCACEILIDTISNPDNIWQIGSPQKTSLNIALSEPNVIITDTINRYPANDTSSFLAINRADIGFSKSANLHLNTPKSAAAKLVGLTGNYWVESDSLKDFGSIEFSPDNGQTWIDLLNDTVYSNYIQWESKPVLTGRSNGWENFFVDITTLGPVLNIKHGDTIIYKFSFISDSKKDSLDGLMFDNLSFIDFWEGIEEFGYNPIESTIYPNPSSDNIIIEFSNPEFLLFQLSIFDYSGKQVLLKNDITNDQIPVNVSKYQPGLYFYKLFNENKRLGSAGKFIIE